VRNEDIKFSGCDSKQHASWTTNICRDGRKCFDSLSEGGAIRVTLETGCYQCLRRGMTNGESGQ
jgi:hypothetical protein